MENWNDDDKKEWLQKQIKAIEEERDSAWNIYLNTPEYQRIAEEKRQPNSVVKWLLVMQVNQYGHQTQEFQKVSELEQDLSLLRQDFQNLHALNNK